MDTEAIHPLVGYRKSGHLRCEMLLPPNTVYLSRSPFEVQKRAAPCYVYLEDISVDPS
jgi:hypothetical protein